jgi:hypothetical protein
MNQLGKTRLRNLDDCREIRATPALASRPHSPAFHMSEPAENWVTNPLAGYEPGQLGEMETWWVERQKALELAGYMLRPRYRPDWKPSWIGTNKYFLNCEDGQPQKVSIYSCFKVIVLTYLSVVWSWMQLGPPTGKP